MSSSGILLHLTKEDLVELITSCVEQTLLKTTKVSIKEENFISISDVASLLNLSKSTIYGYTHKNIIPFHKTGKNLLFLKSEIIEWATCQKKAVAISIEEQADNILALHNPQKRK